MELSRRHFLRAVLGSQLGGAVWATGCRSDRRPAVEGALLGPDVDAGHRLRGPREAREALVEQARSRPVERCAVAIVGGGPAGLACAWQLARRGVDDFALLELEARAGGTSAGGDSALTPFPWGAHYLPVPSADNEPLVQLLGELGVVHGLDAAGHPKVVEPYLVRQPQERLFYRGFWYDGLIPPGASSEEKAELARFEALTQRWAATRDERGRRAFTLPMSRCSDDPRFTALDALDGARWLEAQGLRSPRLRWLLDYACRDDYGLRLEQTSAWALLFYFAARIRRPGEQPAPLITWPEGNAALVQHLGRGLGARLRTGRTVLDVREGDGRVWVTSVDRAGGDPRRLEARRAVLAVPSFVRRRLLPADATPEAPFPYSPWIVAALQLSGRPGYRGAPPAWDNVLYDSPSLGYVSATHQRGSDWGPTLWSYYLPLTTGPARARAKLLSADWSLWRDAVLGDLRRAHPDLDRHLRRLDVWRWGHAMPAPVPGSVWHPARVALARRRGRLHFAHTDCSGLALFEEAFDHGVRAADEAAQWLA